MNTDHNHASLSPQKSELKARSAIIVGGGLAGMATAVALRAVGWKVTLIDSRATWGGRASSYLDPESGELLDNSQHILMGCCTNLLDFYERMGMGDQVAWISSLPTIDDTNPAGRKYTLRSQQWLPAPLHLSLGFATYGLLSLSEKIAAARAMRAMLAMSKSGREKLANVSFGHWLDEHRQPESLLKKLYDPVLVGALNENTREVSAKYAIQVFQDALLAHRRGFVIGVAKKPMSDLYEKLPQGMTLLLNTRVDEICFEASGKNVRAVGVKLRGGVELHADVIVLATNHHAVQKWVGPEFYDIDPRFARLERIEAVPILGSYMVFDRPILREPMLGFVEGPLQWIFKKNASGTAVAGVISMAQQWSTMPKPQVLDRFAQQIRTFVPGARDAKLLRGTMVTEKRATFSPKPGIDALRPTQGPPAGGIQGLYLAGDYTQTNWPATMEGAVRSGYLAAQAVCGRKFLVEDLSVEWVARILGL